MNSIIAAIVEFGLMILVCPSRYSKINTAGTMYIEYFARNSVINLSLD